MIGSSLAVLGFAAGLVLSGLRDSIVFFTTPTMAAERHIGAGKRFRLGGCGPAGLAGAQGGLTATISIADGGASVPVSYRGILPDLFREGQGVVAEGALDASSMFRADPVLAKHDETYMPREVANVLKKQGHWKADNR
uniref:Cytochrome c-type biogenesis protein CcmE n=1 Tax=Bradyrhizobium septentrionale TaxID=1404411 RepID=A0A973VXA5_9BRAD|nr:cytochrome c maturation protein CcmE [Bradyrhizobium sp. 6(2017)]